MRIRKFYKKIIAAAILCTFFFSSVLTGNDSSIILSSIQKDFGSRVAVQKLINSGETAKILSKSGIIPLETFKKALREKEKTKSPKAEKKPTRSGIIPFSTFQKALQTKEKIKSQARVPFLGIQSLKRAAGAKGLSARSELRICESRSVFDRFDVYVIEAPKDNRKTVGDFLNDELPKLLDDDVDQKMFRALYEKILLEQNSGLSLDQILAKKDYPKDELQAIADEAKKRIENLVKINDKFSDALMEEVAKEFPEDFKEFVEAREGDQAEMLKDAAHMTSHAIVEDTIVGELILDLLNEKGEPETPFGKAVSLIAKHLKGTKEWFLYKNKDKNPITEERLAKILSHGNVSDKLKALLEASKKAFAMPKKEEEKKATPLPAAGTSKTHPGSHAARKNETQHGQSNAGGARSELRQSRAGSEHSPSSPSAARAELRANGDVDLLRGDLEGRLAEIYVEILAEKLGKSVEEVRRGKESGRLVVPERISKEAYAEAQSRLQEELQKEQAAQAAQKPAKDEMPPFFEDLTEKAKEGKLRRIYYRDQIVSDIASRLAKNKNASVLLVGEPGTGKTAIAQLLAQKMVAKELGVGRVDGARLLRLKVEVFQAMAGATIDTFSAAFLAFLEEAKKPNTYVFIDEFQKLSPDNNVPGATDSFYRSLLEPLESGGVRIIAATTKKHFERSIKPLDDVMERFGGSEGYIKVDPLSPEQSKRALKEIRADIEKHYNEGRPSSEHVHITDEAIYAAVDLTEEHMPWKVLIRKAEEALDTAASIVSDRASRTRAAIKSLKEDLAREVNYLQTALLDRSESAIQSGNKAISDITMQLAQKTELLRKGFSYAVGKEDIREALLQTGIPKHRLDGSTQKILKTLAAEIKTVIRGQDELIDKIVDNITISYHMKQRGAPLGTFWIDGATGTGKTELAKQLAIHLMNAVFKDGAEDPQFIKINAGELDREHKVDKLFGAPPGYVGYKAEGGELLQKVKKNPYSVILIDEADKAFPTFFDRLLGIIDGGYTTAPDGTYIDFSQTIIIFTSNLGFQGDEAQSLMRKLNSQWRERIKTEADIVKLGESDASNSTEIQVRIQALRQKLENLDAEIESHRRMYRERSVQVKDQLIGKEIMRTEFWNKLTVAEPLVADALPPDIMTEIVDKVKLTWFERQYTRQGIDIEFANRDALVEYLIQRGFDARNGARPLVRAIRDSLMLPITKLQALGLLNEGDKLIVKVTADGKKVEIEHKPGERKSKLDIQFESKEPKAAPVFEAIKKRLTAPEEWKPFSVDELNQLLDEKPENLTSTPTFSSRSALPENNWKPAGTFEFSKFQPGEGSKEELANFLASVSAPQSQQDKLKVIAQNFVETLKNLAANQVARLQNGGQSVEELAKGGETNLPKLRAIYDEAARVHRVLAEWMIANDKLQLRLTVPAVLSIEEEKRWNAGLSHDYKEKTKIREDGKLKDVQDLAAVKLALNQLGGRFGYARREDLKTVIWLEFPLDIPKPAPPPKNTKKPGPQMPPKPASAALESKPTGVEPDYRAAAAFLDGLMKKRDPRSELRSAKRRVWHGVMKPLGFRTGSDRGAGLLRLLSGNPRNDRARSELREKQGQEGSSVKGQEIANPAHGPMSLATNKARSELRSSIIDPEKAARIEAAIRTAFNKTKPLNQALKENKGSETGLFVFDPQANPLGKIETVKNGTVTVRKIFDGTTLTISDPGNYRAISIQKLLEIARAKASGAAEQTDEMASNEAQRTAPDQLTAVQETGEPAAKNKEREPKKIRNDTSAEGKKTKPASDQTTSARKTDRARKKTSVPPSVSNLPQSSSGGLVTGIQFISETILSAGENYQNPVLSSDGQMAAVSGKTKSGKEKEFVQTYRLRQGKSGKDSKLRFVRGPRIAAGDLSGHAAFSPDQQTLAVASYFSFNLFGMGANNSGLIAGTETKLEESIESMSFSPDGNMLAVGNMNGGIFLYELTRDGNGVVTGLRSLKPIQTESKRRIRSMSFSPDGQAFVAGSSQGELYLFELIRDPSGKIEKYRFVRGEKSVIGGEVLSASFSQDGKTLVVGGSNDGTFCLYNILCSRSGAIKSLEFIKGTITPVSGKVWSAAFSPDGETFAVGNDKDPAFGLYRLTRNEANEVTGLQLIEGTQTKVKGSVESLAFSADGQRLAVGSRSRRVRLYEVVGSEKKKEQKIENRPQQMELLRTLAERLKDTPSFQDLVFLVAEGDVVKVQQFIDGLDSPYYEWARLPEREEREHNSDLDYFLDGGVYADFRAGARLIRINALQYTISTADLNKRELTSVTTDPLSKDAEARNYERTFRHNPGYCLVATKEELEAIRSNPVEAKTMITFNRAERIRKKVLEIAKEASLEGKTRSRIQISYEVARKLDLQQRFVEEVERVIEGSEELKIAINQMGPRPRVRSELRQNPAGSGQPLSTRPASMSELRSAKRRVWHDVMKPLGFGTGSDRGAGLLRLLSGNPRNDRARSELRSSIIDPEKAARIEAAIRTAFNEAKPLDQALKENKGSETNLFVFDPQGNPLGRIETVEGSTITVADLFDNSKLTVIQIRDAQNYRAITILDLQVFIDEKRGVEGQITENNTGKPPKPGPTTQPAAVAREGNLVSASEWWKRNYLNVRKKASPRSQEKYARNALEEYRYRYSLGDFLRMYDLMMTIRDLPLEVFIGGLKRFADRLSVEQQKRVFAWLSERNVPQDEIEAIQQYVIDCASQKSSPDRSKPALDDSWDVRMRKLIQQILAENNESARLNLVRSNINDIREWLYPILGLYGAWEDWGYGHKRRNWISDTIDSSLSSIGVLGQSGQLAPNGRLSYWSSVRIGAKRYERIKRIIRRFGVSSQLFQEQEVKFVANFVTRLFSPPADSEGLSEFTIVQNRIPDISMDKFDVNVLENYLHFSFKILPYGVKLRLVRFLTSRELRYNRRADIMAKNLRFDYEGNVWLERLWRQQVLGPVKAISILLWYPVSLIIIAFASLFSGNTFPSESFYPGALWSGFKEAWQGPSVIKKRATLKEIAKLLLGTDKLDTAIQNLVKQLEDQQSRSELRSAKRRVWHDVLGPLGSMTGSDRGAGLLRLLSGNPRNDRARSELREKQGQEGSSVKGQEIANPAHGPMSLATNKARSELRSSVIDSEKAARIEAAIRTAFNEAKPLDQALKENKGSETGLFVFDPQANPLGVIKTVEGSTITVADSFDNSKLTVIQIQDAQNYRAITLLDLQVFIDEKGGVEGQITENNTGKPPKPEARKKTDDSETGSETLLAANPYKIFQQTLFDFIEPKTWHGNGKTTITVSHELSLNRLYVDKIVITKTSSKGSEREEITKGEAFFYDPVALLETLAQRLKLVPKEKALWLKEARKCRLQVERWKEEGGFDELERFLHETFDSNTPTWGGKTVSIRYEPLGELDNIYFIWSDYARDNHAVIIVISAKFNKAVDALEGLVNREAKPETSKFRPYREKLEKKLAEMKFRPAQASFKQKPGQVAGLGEPNNVDVELSGWPLSYSPDGNYAIARFMSRFTILKILRDEASGRINSFEEIKDVPVNGINSVTFSKTGKYILAATGQVLNLYVVLRDEDSGEIIGLSKPSTENMARKESNTIFSSDDRHLLVGSWNVGYVIIPISYSPTRKIASLAGEARARTPIEVSGQIGSATFTPANEVLLKLYDGETGENTKFDILPIFYLPEGGVSGTGNIIHVPGKNSFAIHSADGKYVLKSADVYDETKKDVLQWQLDERTGGKIRKINDLTLPLKLEHNEYVADVSLSPRLDFVLVTVNREKSTHEVNDHPARYVFFPLVRDEQGKISVGEATPIKPSEKESFQGGAILPDGNTIAVDVLGGKDRIEQQVRFFPVGVRKPTRSELRSARLDVWHDVMKPLGFGTGSDRGAGLLRLFSGNPRNDRARSELRSSIIDPEKAARIEAAIRTAFNEAKPLDQALKENKGSETGLFVFDPQANPLGVIKTVEGSTITVADSFDNSKLTVIQIQDAQNYRAITLLDLQVFIDEKGGVEGQITENNTGKPPKPEARKKTDDSETGSETLPAANPYKLLKKVVSEFLQKRGWRTNRDNEGRVFVAWVDSVIWVLRQSGEKVTSVAESQDFFYDPATLLETLAERADLIPEEKALWLEEARKCRLQVERWKKEGGFDRLEQLLHEIFDSGTTERGKRRVLIRYRPANEVDGIGFTLNFGVGGTYVETISISTGFNKAVGVLKSFVNAKPNNEDPRLLPFRQMLTRKLQEIEAQSLRRSSAGKDGVTAAVHAGDEKSSAGSSAGGLDQIGAVKNVSNGTTTRPDVAASSGNGLAQDEGEKNPIKKNPAGVEVFDGAIMRIRPVVDEGPLEVVEDVSGEDGLEEVFLDNGLDDEPDEEETVPEPWENQMRKLVLLIRSAKDEGERLNLVRTYLDDLREWIYPILERSNYDAVKEALEATLVDVSRLTYCMYLHEWHKEGWFKKQLSMRLNPFLILYDLLFAPKTKYGRAVWFGKRAYGSLVRCVRKYSPLRSENNKQELEIIFLENLIKKLPEKVVLREFTANENPADQTISPPFSDSELDDASKTFHDSIKLAGSNQSEAAAFKRKLAIMVLSHALGSGGRAVQRVAKRLRFNKKNEVWLHVSWIRCVWWFFFGKTIDKESVRYPNIPFGFNTALMLFGAGALAGLTYVISLFGLVSDSGLPVLIGGVIGAVIMALWEDLAIREPIEGTEKRPATLENIAKLLLGKDDRFPLPPQLANLAKQLESQEARSELRSSIIDPEKAARIEAAIRTAFNEAKPLDQALKENKGSETNLFVFDPQGNPLGRIETVEGSTITVADLFDNSKLTVIQIRDAQNYRAITLLDLQKFIDKKGRAEVVVGESRLLEEEVKAQPLSPADAYEEALKLIVREEGWKSNSPSSTENERFYLSANGRAIIRRSKRLSDRVVIDLDIFRKRYGKNGPELLRRVKSGEDMFQLDIDKEIEELEARVAVWKSKRKLDRIEKLFCDKFKEIFASQATSSPIGPARAIYDTDPVPAPLYIKILKEKDGDTFIPVLFISETLEDPVPASLVIAIASYIRVNYVNYDPEIVEHLPRRVASGWGWEWNDLANAFDELKAQFIREEAEEEQMWQAVEGQAADDSAARIAALTADATRPPDQTAQVTTASAQPANEFPDSPFVLWQEALALLTAPDRWILTEAPQGASQSYTAAVIDGGETLALDRNKISLKELKELHGENAAQLIQAFLDKNGSEFEYLESDREFLEGKKREFEERERRWKEESGYGELERDFIRIFGVRQIHYVSEVAPEPIRLEWERGVVAKIIISRPSETPLEIVDAIRQILTGVVNKARAKRESMPPLIENYLERFAELAVLEARRAFDRAAEKQAAGPGLGGRRQTPEDRGQAPDDRGQMTDQAAHPAELMKDVIKWLTGQEWINTVNDLYRVELKNTLSIDTIVAKAASADGQPFKIELRDAKGDAASLIELFLKQLSRRSFHDNVLRRVREEMEGYRAKIDAWKRARGLDELEAFLKTPAFNISTIEYVADSPAGKVVEFEPDWGRDSSTRRVVVMGEPKNVLRIFRLLIQEIEVDIRDANPEAGKEMEEKCLKPMRLKLEEMLRARPKAQLGWQYVPRTVEQMTKSFGYRGYQRLVPDPATRVRIFGVPTELQNIEINIEVISRERPEEAKEILDIECAGRLGVDATRAVFFSSKSEGEGLEPPRVMDFGFGSSKGSQGIYPRPVMKIYIVVPDKFKQQAPRKSWVTEHLRNDKDETLLKIDIVSESEVPGRYEELKGIFNFEPVEVESAEGRERGSEVSGQTTEDRGQKADDNQPLTPAHPADLWNEALEYLTETKWRLKDGGIAQASVSTDPARARNLFFAGTYLFDLGSFESENGMDGLLLLRKFLKETKDRLNPGLQIEDLEKKIANFETRIALWRKVNGIDDLESFLREEFDNLFKEARFHYAVDRRPTDEEPNRSPIGLSTGLEMVVTDVWISSDLRDEESILEALYNRFATDPAFEDGLDKVDTKLAEVKQQKIMQSGEVVRDIRKTNPGALFQNAIAYIARTWNLHNEILGTTIPQKVFIPTDVGTSGLISLENVDHLLINTWNFKSSYGEDAAALLGEFETSLGKEGLSFTKEDRKVFEAKKDWLRRSFEWWRKVKRFDELEALFREMLGGDVAIHYENRSDDDSPIYFDSSQNTVILSSNGDAARILWDSIVKFAPEGDLDGFASSWLSKVAKDQGKETLWLLERFLAGAEKIAPEAVKPIRDYEKLPNDPASLMKEAVGYVSEQFIQKSFAWTSPTAAEPQKMIWVGSTLSIGRSREINVKTFKELWGENGGKFLGDILAIFRERADDIPQDVFEALLMKKWELTFRLALWKGARGFDKAETLLDESLGVPKGRVGYKTSASGSKEVGFPELNRDGKWEGALILIPSDGEPVEIFKPIADHLKEIKVRSALQSNFINAQGSYERKMETIAQFRERIQALEAAQKAQADGAGRSELRQPSEAFTGLRDTQEIEQVLPVSNSDLQGIQTATEEALAAFGNPNIRSELRDLMTPRETRTEGTEGYAYDRRFIDIGFAPAIGAYSKLRSQPAVLVYGTRAELRQIEEINRTLGEIIYDGQSYDPILAAPTPEEAAKILRSELRVDITIYYTPLADALTRSLRFFNQIIPFTQDHMEQIKFRVSGILAVFAKAREIADHISQMA